MASDHEPADLRHWRPRALPSATPLQGSTCRVERLDPVSHVDDLASIFLTAPDATWDFLPYGPYPDEASFRDWLATIAGKSDPLFLTIIDTKTGQPAGLAALMRVDPANGVIEVGHIHFGPSLKQTAAATEAIFLLMTRVFDELGYRRLEWKCNAINEASRNAALRFGFTYEGTFRQAVIVKGRNRDTAWFSLLDKEWPAVKQNFELWLDPQNFDASGRQQSSLRKITG
ncbi:MAG: GNAT family protein [Hyphomicrobiaceae bacterium]